MATSIGDVAVRFPKCCNPLPGDEIIGFVTRGRGVTIHRTDCINVVQIPEMERERLINAEWSAEALENNHEKYIVNIMIKANNRSGLLADVSRTMSDLDIDMLTVNTRIDKQGEATIQMSFETSSREEYEHIKSKLRAIQDVREVERIGT